MVAKGQTVEEIDQLRTEIFENLDQYKCLEYTNDKTLTEDSHQYDTVEFYLNASGQLVYVNCVSNYHYYHITGDGYAIVELFFIGDKVVFKRNYGYSFKNSQWHLEPDLDDTKVSVIESLREYYRLDGSALVDYKSRRAEGKYADRFTLLDSIPLEAKLERRWSDRCDECIEEEYLSVYRELLKEKGE